MTRGTNAVVPAWRRRRSAAGAALLGVETVDARTQLPVLVPQLPVGLGEPLEPFGERAAP